MATVPLRVVVKEEISQPEAESLAKYIDMYFTGLKLRKIEEASYKKVESGWKTEFYWRQVSDDGSCRLGISLKIALAVEVQFENFDLESPAQMALYSKTLDLTENLGLTYFQNAKTQTIYFVVGSGGGEAEAEAPTKSSMLRSILRRIFSGNATNAFLLFLVLSYALFHFIGDLTVIVIIAMQLVYLFYADATLGKAKALATSLTKIGFRQIFQEKYTQLGRFLDWFRFDPHPPIYFRIARLSALAGRENTLKHTFLSSLGDCPTGFFASI